MIILSTLTKKKFLLTKKRLAFVSKPFKYKTLFLNNKVDKDKLKVLSNTC